LRHKHEDRLAIFEFVIWQIPKSKGYPEGVKYRAWLSEGGKSLLGLDNHGPKGPHLHVRDVEVEYVYRGADALRADIIAMIRKEGFLYEA